jgi:hypothetical protein
MKEVHIMIYNYTPFDPLIWVIFAVFLACTFIIVKMYHRRYPNYPQSAEKDEERERSMDSHIQTEGNTSVESRY